MAIPNRIFIIGPMGAGKTTVGRQLARLTGLDFDDTDHEVQRRTGVDISFIFEKEGEEGFRRRETRALETLSSREGIVLATGGGIVTQPENRRLLAGRGVVVYLCSDIDTQLERTRHDRDRPLLQCDDRRARLTQLMQERDPLYREIADIVIESGGRQARSVAREIMDRLRDTGLPGEP